MANLTPLIDPLVSSVNSILSAIPGVIFSILVLAIGYAIAYFVELIIHRGLLFINFDKLINHYTKASKFLGKLDFSWFLAWISKWYVFILFLPPAAGLISDKLSQLSDFFLLLAAWLPNLIAAILLGLVGFIGADYFASRIVKTKARYARVVADIIKILIIVFTLILVLKQIGLDVTLVENSLLILLAGITFAIALALGVGFGLGLKNEAEKIVKDWRKKIK